ncbi:MAG: DinB family protein [Bacteroidota bacterium]
MNDFFKDIFEYHHHTNQKLADLLLETSDDIREKAIPLFAHSVNAHQIWNARILKLNPFGVHQLHPIEACKTIDNTNYSNTIKILTEFNLNTHIHYQNTKGKTFGNSIQQMLFHVSNHFSHHRGQLVTMLRQHDIEPITTDYIFYKR